MSKSSSACYASAMRDISEVLNDIDNEELERVLLLCGHEDSNRTLKAIASTSGRLADLVCLSAMATIYTELEVRARKQLGEMPPV